MVGTVLLCKYICAQYDAATLMHHPAGALRRSSLRVGLVWRQVQLCAGKKTLEQALIEIG